MKEFHLKKKPHELCAIFFSSHIYKYIDCFYFCKWKEDAHITAESKTEVSIKAYFFLFVADRHFVTGFPANGTFIHAKAGVRVTHASKFWFLLTFQKYLSFMTLARVAIVG